MYTVFGKQPTKQDKTCAANTLFRMSLPCGQVNAFIMSCLSPTLPPCPWNTKPRKARRGMRHGRIGTNVRKYTVS